MGDGMSDRASVGTGNEVSNRFPQNDGAVGDDMFDQEPPLAAGRLSDSR